MDKLKYQVLTEKTIHLLQRNQYTFDVDSRSTKTEIKDWIEQFFGVRVRAMNSHRLPKRKRKNRMMESPLHCKRMIITLQDGYSIPLFLNE
uniref:Large ribosomal subunit protein uL23c n=1 Tax=Osmundastrum cinnamomeum TaxID=3284 RepID=A0A059SR45_OSMCI|nr:ribosomal protein L23 [Osmundastrum cinnamomeum]AHA59599.1 ribosomal protein L23 [Osmundastrum cinnamomeum]